MRILSGNNIDRTGWSKLVRTSATGTWFQTPEAYCFYESMPEFFRPFVVAIINDANGDNGDATLNGGALRGVCVGYVTKEKNAIKQYFTRRAIILGGPALADDATDEEVVALLEAVKTKTRHLQSLYSDLHETTHQSACMQAFRQSEDLSLIAVEQQDASQKHAALTKNTKNIFYPYEPIYIETRNFNDYSKWKEAFEKAGFSYQPHLNFHVDCTDKEAMDAKLSENRKRQIKKAVKSGIEIVEVSAAHLESEENIENKIENKENILEDPPKEEKDSSEKNVISDNQQKSQKKKDEEDIAAWYEILVELYRTRVKTPLFPLSFFIEFYRQGLGKYLLVKYEGKVIGGIMCPILEGRCIYEWFVCGMDTEYRNQNPSVMATYAAMEYGNVHGLVRFDFMGAGKPNEPYGVREFKARFGGDEVEHGRFLCVTKPLFYKLGVFAVKILKHK